MPQLTKKILREALKHYSDFRELVAAEGESKSVIEYRGYRICFFDLEQGIEKLSKRQKEALFLHVIRDLSEKDTAQLMGFKKWSTPVQQYTDRALEKLLKYHQDLEEGEDEK